MFITYDEELIIFWQAASERHNLQAGDGSTATLSTSECARYGFTACLEVSYSRKLDTLSQCNYIL